MARIAALGSMILGSWIAAGIARAEDAPLVDAARRPDRAAVRALLAGHAAVDQAGPDGMTALAWASHLDDVETARILVAAGAGPNLANRYGVTPLALACGNGGGAMVDLLLAAGADPNARLRGGETPLMTAARNGRLGPVRALIARGAEVDARERRGQTALMWAAAEGHAPVVEALIAAGADFRASLPSGFTPLSFAVREGRTDAALTILRAGADVNEAMAIRKGAARGPGRGTSPLILAVENGHFDLAIALLEAGADPNDQRSGFTALHTLTWVRKPNRGDGDDGDPAPIGSGTATSLGLVARLAARGADVNARLARGAAGRGVLNRAGATPFLLASMTADLPLMKLLVQLGADPRLGNVDGSSPLLAAAGVGCLAPEEEAGTEPEAIEALGYLLGLGLDPNAVDANGESAFHGAAYKSFPAVVGFLVEHGARPHLASRPDKYGWTALEIAEGHRPGNFKPSPETAEAIRRALPPPKPSP